MGKSAESGMTVQVIFTEEGIPRWFGPDPVPGSETLALEALRPLLPRGAGDAELKALWRELLIGHCRIDGRWLPRPAAPIPEPESAEATSTAGDAGAGAEAGAEGGSEAGAEGANG